MDHQIDGTNLIPRKEAKLRFRDQIHLAWEWKCAYCCAELGRSATLDHIIPKVKGGLTVRSNLISCCLVCNSHKQHTDWKDWYQDQVFYCAKREEAITAWTNQ